MWALLPYAVGIAVVGFSDNVLTARAFAAKHERIDANQELLALGTANLANGFVQGFPISSSGSRTVLGDAVGSRSQLHSMVALLAVVAVLLFAGPVLETFPDAALGALVIYAATQLIDVAESRRIARFRRSELVITAITAIAVGLFGVLIGIGIAIALSILDLIRRITRPHADVLGYAPGIAGMHSLEDYPDAAQVGGLVVFRYDSPLFFANSDDFLNRALDAVDDAEEPVLWFLLNAEANVEIDLTALDTLEQLRKQLEDRGIRFAMAGSSRTCTSGSHPPVSSPAWATSTSSPPCPPRSRSTRCATGRRTARCLPASRRRSWSADPFRADRSPLPRSSRLTYTRFIRLDFLGACRMCFRGDAYEASYNRHHLA